MDAATSNCCVGQPVASITFQAFRIPRIWRGMGRGQSVFLLKDFSQTTHPLSEKDFCDESQRLSSKHGSLQYIIFMLLSQRLCFVASSFWIDGWCDESHWVSSKLLLQSLWSLCLMKRQKKLGAAWTPRGYWNITALGFAKKTAAGNVEGNFSFVMKVAGFHHKNLATFWILFCDVHFLCQHAFWMSDLFLTDVGHLHQKKCATCWQVCCHRIFFWWMMVTFIKKCANCWSCCWLFFWWMLAAFIKKCDVRRRVLCDVHTMFVRLSSHRFFSVDASITRLSVV